MSEFTNRDTTTAQDHVTFTVKKRDFSNETIHRPSQEMLDYTEYSGTANINYTNIYNLIVYANGSSDDNEGYVSLTLHSWRFMENFEVKCLISVIDSSGKRIYPRTFIFSSDFKSDFREEEDSFRIFDIDKYIKRETLLMEYLVFLPEDVLTLQVDVQVNRVETLMYYPSDFTAVNESFKKEESTDGLMYYLHLDSLVAKRLSEESSYFQRISEISMREKTEGRMNIPTEEYRLFREAVRILMDRRFFSYESISFIFDIYATADKYDIPLVTETCLCFIKLCLLDHEAAGILEVAEEYSLWNMKEIVQNLIDSDIYETAAVKGGFQLKQSSRGCEWIYKFINAKPKTYLQFVKVITKPPFDFYH